MSGTAGPSACAPAAEPTGEPWVRHTIDSSISGSDGVRVGDVNGDGLSDITTGWEEDGIIRVYLHPGIDAIGDPWPNVQVGLGPAVEDAVFVDLDGDGAIDVVGSTEGDEQAVYVYWAPSETTAYADPGAWTREALPAPRRQWMYAAPADIDGANGIDLIVGAKNAAGHIGLLIAPENARDLAGWQFVPIGDVGWTMTLALRDIDGDGDDDILLADRRMTQEPARGDLRGLRWLENPGRGSDALFQPWTNHFIGRAGLEVMFCGAGDFDGDGDIDFVIPDVVTGEGEAPDGGQLAWIENVWNGDGVPSIETGAFVEHTIPWPGDVGRAKAAAFGDVDLDGRQDIVLTFEEASGGRHGVVWGDRIRTSDISLPNHPRDAADRDFWRIVLVSCRLSLRRGSSFVGRLCRSASDGQRTRRAREGAAGGWQRTIPCSKPLQESYSTKSEGRADGRERGVLLDASIVLAREAGMPTITVRNVPPKVVQSLKALAKRHNRSMEQEVRDLLEGYVVERRAILDQIEAGWQSQTRRPTAAEVDAWMAVGRP